jgi:N-acetylglucosaminyl-diphospho-decaprenol L-rhamnosyltransferase
MPHSSAERDARQRPPGVVSAVVVSFHTGVVLADAIESLVAQDELLETVVVDNGNPDVVVDWLRRLHKEGRIVLVTGHGNIGFAAACNLGARKARGQILLLINPDCVLPAGGLLQLLRVSKGLPYPWMLGAFLLNPDGTEQRGSRRRLLTPGRLVVEAFQLYRIAPRHPGLQRIYMHGDVVSDRLVEVPVLSGSNILLPCDAYWSIGGMDESYFLHVEDIDFCYRFVMAGGHVYFCPTVKIVHYKGSSMANPVAVEWHKARGLITYFAKHFRGTCPAPAMVAINLLVLLRFAAVSAVRGPGAALKMWWLRRNAAKHSLANLPHLNEHHPRV